MKIRICLFLFLVFLFPSNIFAACDNGKCDNIDEYTTYINELTKKVSELAIAKDTLSNQIKLISSQIDLTTLRISQIESSINSLEADIAALTVKIDKLDVDLNHLSIILINQINQNYKQQQQAPILASFFTGNFNGFLEQQKYLATAQKNNYDTMQNFQIEQNKYNNSKEEKKTKQIELENQQIKLADQKKNLDKQKVSKANLLSTTQNDEKKYQALKRAAENELSSLLKAKFVGKRNVKKGEPLGLMGNTGYSFGDHLHFGLYDLREEQLADWSYTNDISSYDYLKNHRLPMDDLDLPANFYTSCQEGGSITQCRGNTKYSYLYADHFHHGVDMFSSNKTIYAVEDGVAYFFRNPGSSLGNHVKLFHPDGKMTLYLHMQ